MKVVAAYIRVSTEEQTELSPDSQIRLIREYAKAHDMILPDEYIYCDNGISGREAKKRPAFMQMIATAKQKPSPFQSIIVWKFSRFARNDEESIVYKSLLKKDCGVNVVSISEPIMDGPFGSLIERIIEWMDAFYSIRLSGEVLRGMTEKVEQGGVVAGPAFGYDVINGEYVINEAEAAYVRQMFDDYLNGIGLREIAANLNQKNIKTKRGGDFENRTVEYILRNPVYIGMIRWNPTKRTRRNYDDENIIIKKGKHAPIIEKEIFDSVQSKIAAQKKLYSKNAHKYTPASEYMLRGIIRCSNCGATLSISQSTKSLQCINYSKGKCNKSHSVVLNSINTLVLDTIESLLKSGTFDIIVRDKTTRSEKFQTELDIEYKKLQRIKEAYEAGVDSIDEYKTNKSRIEENIRLLQNKINVEVVPFSKKDYIEDKLNILRQLRQPDISEANKNIMLRSFVDHIVYYRSTRSIRIFLYV